MYIIVRKGSFLAKQSVQSSLDKLRALETIPRHLENIPEIFIKGGKHPAYIFYISNIDIESSAFAIQNYQAGGKFEQGQLTIRGTLKTQFYDVTLVEYVIEFHLLHRIRISWLV